MRQRLSRHILDNDSRMNQIFLPANLAAEAPLPFLPTRILGVIRFPQPTRFLAWTLGSENIHANVASFGAGGGGRYVHQVRLTRYRSKNRIPEQTEVFQDYQPQCTEPPGILSTGRNCLSGACFPLTASLSLRLDYYLQRVRSFGSYFETKPSVTQPKSVGDHLTNLHAAARNHLQSGGQVSRSSSVGSG